MARRYRRSIFIGVDEFGKNAIEKVRDETSDDIKYLNFFLTLFDSKEFKSALSKISELDLESFDTKKYKISSFTKKELFEFIIILIGEDESELLKVWKEADKLIKEKNFTNAEAIIILKTHKGFDHKIIEEFPRTFVLTPDLVTKAKVKDTELIKGVHEFLSLFIHGNIFEDRDSFNKAILGAENRLLSFGVASLSLPVYELVDMAGLIVGKKLLDEIVQVQKKIEEDEDLQSVAKWIDVIDDVTLKEEIGLAHPKFRIESKIRTFSSFRKRRDDFKKLVLDTKNTISMYGNSKNNLAKKARLDLEKNVKKTVKERLQEVRNMIAFGKKRATPLKLLKQKLEILIGKDGLIKESKRHLESANESWETYPKIEFPKEISKHPFWFLIFGFIIVGVIPWLIRLIFPVFITKSFCLESSAIGISIIIIYLLFSKIKNWWIVHKVKENYFNGINGIDKFYHQNIKALVVTYRRILIEKLLKELRNDYKYLSIFIAYLEEKIEEISNEILNFQDISFGERSDQVKISKKEAESFLKDLGILDIQLDEIPMEINSWIKTGYDDFFESFYKVIKDEIRKKIFTRRQELFMKINDSKQLKNKIHKILSEERPLPFYPEQMKTSNIMVYYPDVFGIEEIEEKFKSIKKIEMDSPDKLGVLNISY